VALRVVVVDDHPLYREGVRSALSRHADLHIVGEAGTLEHAVDAIAQERPDVVLLDSSLPGTAGMPALRQILRRDPERRVLVICDHLAEDYAAEALATGAMGCAGKDVSVEEIALAVREVGAGQRYLPSRLALERVNKHLRERPPGNPAPLDVLSARERDVFRLLVVGCSNEEIAGRLRISRRTVETHRSRILKKLRVHSAVELLRLAARHGLIAL
jgi:two-component system, NarL family, invasion response regulator UvrY